MKVCKQRDRVNNELEILSVLDAEVDTAEYS